MGKYKLPRERENSRSTAHSLCISQVALLLCLGFTEGINVGTLGPFQWLVSVRGEKREASRVPHFYSETGSGPLDLDGGTHAYSRCLMHLSVSVCKIVCGRVPTSFGAERPCQQTKQSQELSMGGPVRKSPC